MTRRLRRPRRPEPDGSVLRWPGAASKFALFAEVLLIGMLMAVVCLGVVTWPAAVAAGTAHLRRYLRAEASPVSEFFRDVRRALPGAALLGAATTVLALLVGLDVALAAGGAIPVAAPVAVVAVIALAVVVVPSLRAASSWTTDASWRVLATRAPRAALADPAGTAWAAVALLLAAVVAWQFLPLAVPALGLLAFALVAIDERRAARVVSPDGVER